MPLPENFVRTINSAFAERGTLWLERLPDILAEYAQRWSLRLLPPFTNLTFNYVAPVVQADGTEAVLKAGVPHKELWTEVAALQSYDARGSVRLLKADNESGIFLMERLRPGTTLTTLVTEGQDARATSIAATVMRELWRPVPADHTFPTVRDWAKGLHRLRERFDGGTGPFPLALVEEAETLFAELLSSMEEPVLLHGDLHHDNILSAQRQPWLAIDPKGIVGEPAYEVGALLRNLWEDRWTLTDSTRMLERRVFQLAEELNLDRMRIRGWGIAQAALSAWWCLEDSGDCWEGGIAIADMLSSIHPRD